MEKEQIADLMRKEDQTLRALIDQKDKLLGNLEDQTKRQQQQTDEHIARIQKMNNDQETRLNEYNQKFVPADKLVERFEAGLKDMRSHFLSPDAIKLYFLRLMLENQNQWPTEFRKMLTDEIAKLAERDPNANYPG